MHSLQSDEASIQRYVTAGEGAIAPCFVTDVLELKDAKIGDWSIWWLGSVPCRKVQIVGLVVGAVEYEKRMVYTIDDGTGAIDCVYPLVQIKASPVKPSNPSNPYIRIQSKTKETTATIVYSPPPPIKIGKTACVVGKVEAWNDSKQLLVDTIDLRSINDEPKHWVEVAKLHKTKYSHPFTVPKTLFPTTPARQRFLKRGASQVPGTRSSSIAPSTPSRSSPVKEALAGPSKLRHPMKVSSSQLTTHTFRAHLVQYLDYASRMQASLSPVHRPASSQDDDDPFIVRTPVQKRRGGRPVSPERTPRPSIKGKERELDGESGACLTGFPLSFLRKLPELDCLGRRVVRAELKRRAKEQRLKEKEAYQREKERQRRSQGVLKPSQGSLKPPPKAPSTSPKKFSSERTSLKVKRLFIMTLRTLRDDGTIIIVEGPGRKWDKAGVEKSRASCWRDLDSTMDLSTASGINNTTSTTTSSLAGELSICMNMDEDPPSDPDPTYEEECYLPVTAYVLAQPVLQAMKQIIPTGGGMKGATVQEILRRMKGWDGRWSRLHEEHINQTIEHLVDEERVWQVGQDKWGLVM